MTDALRALFVQLVELRDRADIEVDPGHRAFLVTQFEACKKQVLAEIVKTFPCEHRLAATPPSEFLVAERTCPRR